tara:strand:- start:2088 stop:2450 length:363 start_codon:yes stop_codon:yes gene_type:complete
MEIKSENVKKLIIDNLAISIYLVIEFFEFLLSILFSDWIYHHELWFYILIGLSQIIVAIIIIRSKNKNYLQKLFYLIFGILITFLKLYKHYKWNKKMDQFENNNKEIPHILSKIRHLVCE